MKHINKIGILVLLLASNSFVTGQDSTQGNKLVLNGYIKSLQTLSFNKDFSDCISGNLLHNRINLRWNISSYITAAAELRNRMFWGEEVRFTPGFKNSLQNQNEVLDLAKTWSSTKNMLIHSNTERLWVEYKRSNWKIRAGRQRINWAIATTWNPNDIFNTYNFLDFDYEERPGSDAVDVRYSLSDFSNLEIAISPSDQKNKTVAAAKYFLNKWGYDMQMLAGIYQSRITLGLGWAGNIRDMGFKGEGQLYMGNDSGFVANYTMEADYVFKSGWYVSGTVLYNSEGLEKPVSDWTKIDFSPSPVKLMPTRWNFVLSASKEFTPLFSGRMSVLYSPGTNLLMILPSFSYSLAENFTADLVSQSFFTELNQFEAINHRVFLRVKWNF